MEHEVLIRLGAFLGLFAVFAVFERIAPKVAFNRPVKLRWITRFSAMLINTLILRLNVACPSVFGYARRHKRCLAWMGTFQ